MAKWNRGRKQRERRKFSEGQPPHPKHIITIRQSFQQAEEFIGLGPFVRGEWAVPPTLQEQRKQDGLPALGAIAGPMMIDTGAEVSLISSAVVEALSLPPATNMVSPNPEDGFVPGPYLAELGLYVDEGKGQKRAGFVRRVIPVPGLEQNIPEPGSNEPSPGLIGVLGRDFLQHAVLIYDGPNHTYQLEIHTSSLKKDT